MALKVTAADSRRPDLGQIGVAMPWQPEPRMFIVGDTQPHLPAEIASLCRVPQEAVKMTALAVLA